MSPYVHTRGRLTLHMSLRPTVRAQRPTIRLRRPTVRFLRSECRPKTDRSALESDSLALQRPSGPRDDWLAIETNNLVSKTDYSAPEIDCLEPETDNLAPETTVSNAKVRQSDDYIFSTNAAKRLFEPFGNNGL